MRIMVTHYGRIVLYFSRHHPDAIPGGSTFKATFVITLMCNDWRWGKWRSYRPEMQNVDMSRSNRKWGVV